MTVTNISSHLIEELTRQAQLNFRYRAHLNFHANHAEPVQRLANAVEMNSYIRPHRHLLDPRSECLIALKGSFALIVFDDLGSVESSIRFGSECHINNTINYGVDISSDVWHTVIALTSCSVLFEAKAGPYLASKAKEFASWAPAEGSPEAVSYLENLRNYIISI